MQTCEVSRQSDVTVEWKNKSKKDNMWEKKLRYWENKTAAERRIPSQSCKIVA